MIHIRRVQPSASCQFLQTFHLLPENLIQPLKADVRVTFGGVVTSEVILRPTTWFISFRSAEMKWKDNPPSMTWRTESLQTHVHLDALLTTMGPSACFIWMKHSSHINQHDYLLYLWALITVNEWFLLWDEQFSFRVRDAPTEAESEFLNTRVSCPSVTACLLCLQGRPVQSCQPTFLS